MLALRLFTLAALLAASLFAQESRATVQGRVTDASGALVAGAEVRLTNKATAAALAAKTNESGNYTIPFVIPGVYAMTVEKTGFKKYTRLEVPVRVNDVLELDIPMEVGDSTQSIDVTAEVPLLESANASIGQVIDERRATELPIQAGNPFELFLLAPGVVNTTNLRLRKASATNAVSQLSTAGNPQYSNEFTIDGIPNTFADTNQPRIAFSPPQNAVSEFKVQTTGYEANLGHTSGSVVNVTTKGGTNELHGELHYWFGNSALDAPNFFQNRAGQKKQVYQDNRFGGSLGGPIVLPKMYNGKNRSFFFYSAERNTWGVPRTFLGSVPTDAQRAGDLSGLLALGAAYQVYDPLSGFDAGNGRVGRLPVAGNRIPANRVSPVARNLARYWGQPNQAGTREGRNNYSVGVNDADKYYVHLFRVDHTFSENHRIYVRGHYDWWDELKQNYYFNNTNGVNLNRINRGLALDDVYVISPSMIFNFRYGFTQQEFPERRPSQGFDIASLGFSPSTVRLTNPETVTFPAVGFAAIPSGASVTIPNSSSLNSNTLAGIYSGFGGWENGDGKNASQIHSFMGNFTWLKGNHSMKFGADIRNYRAFRGRFGWDVSPVLAFSNTYTRGPLDTSAVSPVGQELAAFLYGVPEGEMRRSASYASQDNYYSFFFQDDWKLTRKLTLNLGLRYEYETPLTERFNRASSGFAGTTSNPIEPQARVNYARSPIPEIPPDQFRVLGGLQFVSASNRGLWTGEKNNLMPRIGLAYEFDAKTVLRAGYGLFFDTIGTNRSETFQNGFTGVTPILTSLDNGLTLRVNSENPWPEGLNPARAEAVPLTTDLGRPLTFYPTTRVNPYSQRWSLGLQRQLPAGFLLEASYTGNRGARLQILRDINATPERYLSKSPARDQATINYLGANFANPFFGLDRTYARTISRADLVKPYPQFGRIQVMEPIGYSWYHAFMVRAERRFSYGFSFQLSYTWSKMMEATEYLNQFETQPYESLSSFDRQHRTAMSWIWELPFGKGRKFGSSMPGLAEALLGGWQLNGVWQLQSGQPIDWGNYIPKGTTIALSKDERSVDRWFNPEFFDRVAANQLASNVRTFPLRFSNVRGDGHNKMDLSLIKTFSFSERWKMQFRAEAYNAMNHPNFMQPASNNVTATGFAQVTSVNPARQFQLALKLTF